MASIGLEHHAKTPEKPHVSNSRGTECGTLSDDSDQKRRIPPDLEVVIEAWPRLPADVRKMIAGVVKLTPKDEPDAQTG